ncbi:uncharacterized protein LOC110102474 [Dendrobium catenatum]|uniref:uncharacterized protein LOC110102474 n=1 Tax=Dendrobium catenatum TaxID=906689 RepID=UPI0009F364E5|nr:uncharacterized protein LOC110102474 [Dendrobium catenatum]
MSAFMVDKDLHDQGFTGPKFTWSNNKQGSNKVWVRLDRVLMNSVGLQFYPLASVKHMLRLASDHCPLLLRLTNEPANPGSKWIRFEDVWRTFPATWKVFWKSWTKHDHGQPDDVLNRKCSRTLRSLFLWSRNHMKDLGETKIVLEARLAELQLLESSPVGLNSVQESELRKTANDLITNLARTTTWWKQCAKTRWIEEGDANSHFFHSSASARRRSNRIVEIQTTNGERTSDQNKIQEEFLRFFTAKWRD